MEQAFAVIGACAVVLGILVILKICFDRRDSNSRYFKDPKVFEAAKTFASGDYDYNETKDILLQCIDLDEEEVEQILSAADKVRSDQYCDQTCKYNEFLKSVDRILGVDIYSKEGQT